MPMRTRVARTLLLLFLLLPFWGCENGAPTSPGLGTPEPLAGFTLSGDPASQGGATWTYTAQVAGTNFDLQGILHRPAGTGPFPAVIISHGNGGNVQGYSRAVAREMVTWGLVAIATNYTHAGGVPVGSPGTASEPGASPSNVQRARRLVEILRSLGYVDMNRVALHGHSMGAFVTAATAGAHPALFRAASHTAGGIRPDSFDAPAPTENQVAGIRAPYQIHHGDRDFVVPLLADQLFAAALAARGVRHELHVYPTADHDDLAGNPIVFERIRTWYRTHGIF